MADTTKAQRPAQQADAAKGTAKMKSSVYFFAEPVGRDKMTERYKRNLQKVSDGGLPVRPTA